MVKREALKILITTIMCLLIILTAAACFGNSGKNDPDPTPPPTTEPLPTPPPPTEPPEPEPVVLVPYDGVVEHLFFHEVIAYPEVAFPNQTDANRLDDYMITVHEFNMILKGLHKNNFVLIDMNDVWSEFINDSGNKRMRRNTLMIPEGKKPIVLSFDDLSFYNYMTGDGFMSRYIVGHDGEIWAEGVDPRGNPVVSQDLAAITVLDKFVKENPDFSHNGAKGCLALTGYEGILGYRTQTDKSDNSQEFRLNRMQEVARVKPVVERLHETGWYFASHSWGHIRFSSASLNLVKEDAARWKDEVGSLVGDTVIMIYAHGERLDGNDVWRETAGPALRFYVDDMGFRMFASVGYEPFSKIRTDVPAVMMDRMNSDGITLRRTRDRFMRFYDAKEVFDPLRPTNIEKLWD